MPVSLGRSSVSADATALRCPKARSLACDRRDWGYADVAQGAAGTGHERTLRIHTSSDLDGLILAMLGSAIGVNIYWAG